MTKDYIIGCCMGYLQAKNRLSDFLDNIEDRNNPDLNNQELSDIWGRLYDTTEELFDMSQNSIPFSTVDLSKNNINSLSEFLDVLIAYVEEHETLKR